MKKLSRSEVLAEALNCGAFQNDGSHQIPAGLLVTFEVDELMVFVETIIRESLGGKATEAQPLAVLRYERGQPGHENDMPRVMSCNWLPDGVYPVYLSIPAPAQADSIHARRTKEKNAD